MKILLTNDDGVDAPGIAVLANHLVGEGHYVTIAAPSSNRSGSSAALGSVSNGVLIRSEERAVAGSAGLSGLGIDAPPAMIVHAFCSGPIDLRPDLVVSGINDGHNTGRAIIHSGTVGAAVTAASFGIPAFAISTGPLPGSRFDTAAIVLAAVLRRFVASSGGFALNVNVPDLAVGDILGARQGTTSGPGLADIAYTRSSGGFDVRKEYWSGPLAPASDSGLVRAGYVSISAVAGETHAERALESALGAIVELLTSENGEH